MAPDPINQSIDQLGITFSKPVTGLDLANLVLTFEAAVVNWTDQQTVTTTDGMTWTLDNLAGLTSTDGAYTLTLDPNANTVEPFPGNPLLVGDNIGWNLDTVVPKVVFVSPAPSAAFVGIDTVSFLFDEPVSGFDRSDLLLTRGGLEIPLTVAQTLTTGDNQTYTLNNLLPLNSIPGHYEVSLLAKQSDVADMAANRLPVGSFKTWQILLKVDADLDDDVDGNDFLIWQRNFGLGSGALPTDADSDGDGDVDAGDLADWQAGFGTALPPAPQVTGFDGSGFATFAALQSAYTNFLGTAENSIAFDGLSGVITPTQFTATHGVTFANLGQGGAFSEGDAGTVENLDGYDGTYQANGDTVYVNFPNHLQPLTFTFSTPVARVGSFVGIGKEGTIDTLTVTALDTTGVILTNLSVSTQLFADGSNREAFWAVATDQPAIAKISILNDSSINFANALILDTIAWSTTTSTSAASSAPVVALTTTGPPVEEKFVGASAEEINSWVSRWPIVSIQTTNTKAAGRISPPSQEFRDRREADVIRAVDALFASYAGPPRWNRAHSDPIRDDPPNRWRTAIDEALTEEFLAESEESLSAFLGGL